MIISRIGVDLSLDSRLSYRMKDKSFLQKVFHPSELATMNEKKLSGIFAAKEALFKALDCKSQSWLEVEVTHSKSGRPQLILSESIKPKSLQSIDLSISHENGMTIAVVSILLKEKNEVIV